MKKYRIYTENKNLEKIKELASSYLESFTIFQAGGCWKGAWEDSVVIESIGKFLLGDVRRLAMEIKKMNDQEAVLITQEDVEIILI
jgi:hypothetical protein